MTQPTPDDQQRYETDLDLLREQRAQLVASLSGDAEPGDAADAADTMGRADELRRVDDQIARLTTSARHGPAPGALPIGTRAVLRHPDGSAENIEVGYTVREDPTVTVVTEDSPLARALAGHTAGETVSWHIPAGRQSAELMSVSPPETERGGGVAD